MRRLAPQANKPEDWGERATLALPSGPVSYVIYRSRRRTVGFAIEPGGALVVTAPWRMALPDVEAMVRSNARWVTKHCSLAQTVQLAEAIAYTTGDRIPWLGGSLELVHVTPAHSSQSQPGQLLLFTPIDDPTPGGQAPGLVPTVTRLGQQLRVEGTGLTAQTVRDLIADWFGIQAANAFPPVVAHYAQRIGHPVKAVQIHGKLREWGSCTADGIIRLNWRLLLGPPAYAEYVAAHEVCHLIHKHHKPAFWKCLGTLFPAAREIRRELKLKGETLHLPPVRER